MINNDDIRTIYQYLLGEAVDTKVIDKLTKKFELIVKQIEVQEEFNNKMDEISSEFEKIK